MGSSFSIVSVEGTQNGGGGTASPLVSRIRETAVGGSKGARMQGMVPRLLLPNPIVEVSGHSGFFRSGLPDSAGSMAPDVPAILNPGP